MSSTDIEGGETPRGKFYTFDVPQNPVSLTYVDTFIPEGRVIQTQFSEEEVEFISRAREAARQPEILRTAAETSTFRMLRVPFYGELRDRRKAFDMIQRTVQEADWTLTNPTGASSSVIDALKTIKTNLLPFLPPERPPLRER